MLISIIIPFVEKNEKILKCIGSIKKQNYKKVEIITISEKTKLKIKGVRSILSKSTRDVGEKRNLGAKMAKGDVLLFLDYDCVMKKDSIEKLVEVLEETKADAVSGKTLAPRKGNLLGVVTGLEYEDRFDQMGEGFVDVAATTCFGVRKESFKNSGGFKVYSHTERAVGEDWDFSMKFRQMGYKIYHTNKFQVFHEHNDETLSHWLMRRFQHSKYRMKHYKKYKKSADQYSSWKMFVSSTLLLSFPTVFRVIKKSGDFRILALPYFALLRNFAWMLGFIVGLMEK